MNYYFTPMFYMFFLVGSTLMVISSSSMFTVWLGLELNLMSFLPLICMLGEGKGNSESMIKYFLVQAISSSIVIFMFMWSFIYDSSLLWELKELVLNVALGMKVGLAPFHFWFPEVIMGMNWMGSFILITWQKISPLYILSLIFSFKFLIILSVISAMVGAISGLSQVSLQKILAFSSISHLGWITGIICMSSMNWLFYLIIYILITLTNCISFWYFNIGQMSQLYFQKDLSIKFPIFLNLLSTGGLPPLMGFGAKLVAFKILYSYTFVIGVLLLSSLITLYFYVRLCISSFTTSIPNLKLGESNYDTLNWTMGSFILFMSFLGIVPIIYFL